MRGPRSMALATVLLSSSLLPAQSLNISAGSSSLFQAQGLTASLYQPGRTTRISLGNQHGFLLGLQRETTIGNRSIAIGDEQAVFHLPTDLEDGSASLPVRGTMLREHSATSDFAAFAGATGQSFSTQFLSGQRSSDALAYISGRRMFTPRFELSGLTLQRASHNTSLISAQELFPNRSLIAIAAGTTEGSPVARFTTDIHRDTWRVLASESLGNWKLRRQVSVPDALPLERSGFNISAQKQLFHAVVLDAARQSFASTTSSTREQSQMKEAGASFHLDRLNAAARAFSSTDGVNPAHAEIAMLGWNMQRTQLRISWMQTASRAEGASRNALFEVSQRVRQRLRLTAGTNLSGSTVSFSAGGSYDARWGLIAAEQHTYYLPFGQSAGLQRLWTLSLRTHSASGRDVAIDDIFGAHVGNQYTAVTDAWIDGPAGGDSAYENRRQMPALPKFLIGGRVLSEDGTPIRGAAVKVAQQTVYTDSDGRFEARFHAADPVRVALDPLSFLTGETYQSQTQAQLAVPGAPDAATLELHANRCNGCLAGISSSAPSSIAIPEAEPSFRRNARSSWAKLLRREF